ncbi:FAD-dependent oxidoreductase [Gordonia amarae]|uniref:FAD-dependent oxidoreductase n=2 Tax=Gordonia amarae TaxID=36821 RepID=A0A857L300_9ACTN|nr:FAD-dependent monooxygenase [Gordonia amarae]MCS3876528.1 3-(3-hydroxy-phenyl)propionate hydroxylase/6-hydroxy-3-succinoylpyridine 3-monooxygenase [Gordonia amarae]QHN19430.1 FAD-dependent oxidoreductase [Gordonia amarae]QHN23906.1 FAD-dependent oxidoreductase [Gordonia amarae]QHN32816.1 FAD-dependent oxidoreductase [Gordonia amarae]QHN41535.1 FAD-dependent oxidoreductase [Gordonia amarae]
MADDQQVIVAGAGPTGLLNALGLARQGVRVTVVERFPEIPSAPRAPLYHWSVLEGLERLGVLEDALAAGFTKQDYEYRVRETGEIVAYGLQCLEGHVKYPFNLHLGQHRLAEIALQHLERYDNARVLFGHKVTGVSQDDGGVDVTVWSDAGEHTLHAQWLIGADGAQSAVRKALPVEFDGMTWPERFVATNLRFPDNREGWSQTTFYLDGPRGAIIVKIDNSGEHGLWRYTWMEDAALPEETVGERLPGMLAHVFGEDVAARCEIVATAPYRMHQRAASSFRADRVLLAGDAAHITNPSGGLGLTMGLFDSYVLNEAIGAVIAGDADESILDQYAELRRAAFLDKASPRAVANKTLIFHSDDPSERDRNLEVFRRMGSDPDLAREVLSFTKTLETPSLIGAW